MEPAFYKKIALSNSVYVVLMTVTDCSFVAFNVNRKGFVQQIQKVASLLTNIFMLCRTGYSAQTNETANE